MHLLIQQFNRPNEQVNLHNTRRCPIHLVTITDCTGVVGGGEKKKRVISRFSRIGFGIVYPVKSTNDVNAPTRVPSSIMSA